jgi:ureidoglycolate lyase
LGPFGTVIDRDGADIRMINEGTTTRFHALSDVDVAAEGGTPILSIFAGHAAANPYHHYDAGAPPVGIAELYAAVW